MERAEFEEGVLLRVGVGVGVDRRMESRCIYMVCKQVWRYRTREVVLCSLVHA